MQLRGRRNKKNTSITPLQTCGSLLVIPPEKSSFVVETCLPALSEFLSQKQTRRQLEKWSLHLSEGEGVRRIQGGRFEIYLDAPDKTSKAFEWMEQTIHKLYQIDNIRSRILEFAKKQARKDPRIGSGQYVFDNFSLLVSFDPVKAQLPHLDMVEPNLQFGLVITDNSPGTVVYEPINKIATMEDVKDVLWKDLPHSVGEPMQTKAHTILQQYGNVLCKNLRSFYPGLLQQGALCCMPGGVIHSGPACDHFRAVLFFSACPRGTLHLIILIFNSLLLPCVHPWFRRWENPFGPNCLCKTGATYFAKWPTHVARIRTWSII